MFYDMFLEDDDPSGFGPEGTDPFEVKLALDPERGRMAAAYTLGLEYVGLPELLIQPPDDFEPPGGLDWAHASVHLMRGMGRLAEAMLRADSEEVGPDVTEIAGAMVAFRLLPAHESRARLRLDLPEHFGDMTEVACSWWQP
ncbi:hypothetical protein ACIB24_11745 [Spongisporangium articulatum]|uniref:Uncharacterized protein n=1 Tax=Spongisporangium articulatum TaxID=3362603 RepID=A0ABW8AP67_9ACTN